MLASLASWLTPGSLFLLLNIVIGTIFLTSRFTSARRPQPGHEYRAPPLARSPSLLERVKSIDFSFYKYPNHDAPIDNSPDQYAAPPPLDRTPSLLDRVRSINFNSYNNFTPSYTENDVVLYPNPEKEAAGPYFQQPTRNRSFLERVKSIDFTSFYRSDSIRTNPESEFLSEPESDSVPDPTREPSHVTRSKSERTETHRRIPKKSASENWDQEEEEERNLPATSRIERTASIGEGADVDLKADHFINKFKQQLKLQRLDSLIRYKEMLKGKLM